MHFDAHVHSAASPDSELNPVDAIKVLKAKGLGVIFTEHADFVIPKEGMDLSATDAPNDGYEFVCDFEIYPSQYRHLRSDSVLLGIEIGLTAAYLPLNTQVADNDYDFVLGSVHYVDGHNVYTASDSMEAGSFCRRYLTYTKEMVEISGFFDSLGHIDYIARYSDRIKRIFHYKNFPQEFDALLKALAERDLAMEINTSRFNSMAAQLLPIYKRFKELGGKYITVGSDAHNKGALGRHHKKAVGMVAMAGLTPVYYKERQRYVL